MSAINGTAAQARDIEAPPFSDAAKVWARIGLLSFGGPAGQIALMHKELVERRRWIDERRFLHALNYCMLLPGPEAQQLAIYIGWLMHRTAGGLVAGILFVLPGALVMLGLSMLYVGYRHLPIVDAAFVGIKAAVVVIVIEALIRIGRRAIRSRTTAAIAAAAFLALFVLHIPFPIVIMAAGFLGWAASRVSPQPRVATPHDGAEADDDSVIGRMARSGRLAHASPSPRHAIAVGAVWLPIWLAPVAAIAVVTGTGSVWSQLGAFFGTMAVVTFGGAYAVLSYVAQAAVSGFGWLQPGEMIDGLGLAETTPGPLILVLQFVGFLAAYREPGGLPPMLAGCLGAALTLWVTFAPCFLWIFLGAPWIEALRHNKDLAAALSAVTAAVVGVIMNLAAWFALHVFFRSVEAVDLPVGRLDVPVLGSIDWVAVLLCAAAMLAMMRLRWGMVPVLLASALAAAVLKGSGLA